MNNKNFKPWMILVVCCGPAGSSIGISINASGVFYAPVSESLGIMRGTFSMHMTIFSFVTALTALMVPKLMKKFSYKALLTFGVILAVISTGMMAYSQHIAMFYFLGAVRGFSTALFSAVPLTMIINGWFQKKHGIAMSIVFGSSGIAGSIFSPILSKCIANFGWHTAYIIKAGMILVLCLPAVIMQFKVTAKEEGAVPYGYEEEAAFDEEVKNNGQFKFATAAFMCFFIFSLIVTTITGITQHLPGFSAAVGFGASVGAYLLSAGMIGNVASKLVIGAMSDKLGPIKASIFMVAVNTCGILMLLLVKNTYALFIGAFLFGSVYSIGSVGLPLLTKKFFGIENYSKVFPIISFASNMGAAFALSLVGYIYDFTGSYSYAFIAALIIDVACISLIMIVKNKSNYGEFGVHHRNASC